MMVDYSCCNLVMMKSTRQTSLVDVVRPHGYMDLVQQIESIVFPDSIKKYVSLA